MANLNRRFGLMVARVMSPERIPVLVDLGQIADRATRNCADRLMAYGVSRKRFSIEGNNRLLCALPPKDSEKIIKRFRFAPKSTYWQATHCRAALAKGGAHG